MTVNLHKQPNFACIDCGRSDKLAYSEHMYEIVCSACKIRYSIEEISQHATMNESYWVTKDKRAMPIRSMTDSHLNNAIGKLIREPDWRPGTLEKLLEELEKRRGSEAA